ncbi:putative Uncharacterized protein YnbD [Nannochloris sp. 'desiccata']|nr:hypothetical protein KSW81_007566 [Chlorella desiccata (nom. nud.)]KAH7618803.1 putative Uncharacterized protein YnbD [Chlorella desiccata (nom. nud.)]
MGIHLSGVVGGIASLPALCAVIFRKSLPLPASLILWHIAGTGIVISIAASSKFARHSTWLLGKRKDGTINPVSKMLLWPYHAGLRAKLAIQRHVSSEPAWDQITPTYFIGAWPSEQALVPAAHPAVLDVTCELPLQVRPPAYKMIPVWDTHSPLPDQIDDAVVWAQEQERQGRQILIHCAHGHGRSATVLCAILVANGQAQSIAEAEATLKKERPRVRLNVRQRAAVTEWFNLKHKAN